MFDVTWSDYAYSDYIKYAAKDMIGDPDKDAAILKAASPLENAAKIRAPVLMAYGGSDRRVPIIHGEKMTRQKQARPSEVKRKPRLLASRRTASTSQPRCEVLLEQPAELRRRTAGAFIGVPTTNERRNTRQHR
jgi:hypothetical protein